MAQRITPRATAYLKNPRFKPLQRWYYVVFEDAGREPALLPECKGAREIWKSNNAAYRTTNFPYRSRASNTKSNRPCLRAADQAGTPGGREKARRRKMTVKPRSASGI